MTEPATALSRLRALMDAHDWRAAILFAARFGRLGEQRDRILSAREAINRPDFQRQLGRDPQALIDDGKKALRERYGRHDGEQ